MLGVNEIVGVTVGVTDAVMLGVNEIVGVLVGVTDAVTLGVNEILGVIEDVMLGVNGIVGVIVLVGVTLGVISRSVLILFPRSLKFPLLFCT
jgi:hypothetical protein